MNDRIPAPNAASRVTFSSTSNGLQRNVSSLRGQPFHLDVVPLDGREILVEEIPLPPFGWIRGLQPVPRRYWPRKHQTVGVGIRRPRHGRRDRLPDIRRAFERQVYTERAADVNENLPVFHGFARRRDRARPSLHATLVVGV